jgi:hypothetical protein
MAAARRRPLTKTTQLQLVRDGPRKCEPTEIRNKPREAYPSATASPQGHGTGDGQDAGHEQEAFPTTSRGRPDPAASTAAATSVPPEARASHRLGGMEQVSDAHEARPMTMEHCTAPRVEAEPRGVHGSTGASPRHSWRPPCRTNSARARIAQNGPGREGLLSVVRQIGRTQRPPVARRVALDGALHPSSRDGYAPLHRVPRPRSTARSHTLVSPAGRGWDRPDRPCGSGGARASTSDRLAQAAVQRIVFGASIARRSRPDSPKKGPFPG